MNGWTPPEPTERQVSYIRALQHRLRLPDRMLDDHCVATFGQKFASLNRGQASDLIDQLAKWEAVPADLQRMQGQQDLFTF